MSEKIRVLIVDDSALVRQSLKSILDSDPEIEVVGEARNGREGYDKTLTLRPNVITMDLTMPVMDGLEAVEKIMEECPTSIVVVSSRDTSIIVKALALGAMDFVAVTQEIVAISEDLIQKVKIASRVRPIRRIKINNVPKKIPGPKDNAAKVVAIGVSTGGPQALQVVLSGLPADFPAGILIVQHISPGFIQGLVEWLSLTSPLHIQLARTGETLKNGTVFFAPDGYHMAIDDNGRILLKEELESTMLHVPAINVMMEAVAGVYGRNAIGVIMTGMGRDGVNGISAIKKAGGVTIAQDEKTSSIYGMNRLAIEAGMIERVLPLESIADELVRLTR